MVKLRSGGGDGRVPAVRPAVRGAVIGLVLVAVCLQCTGPASKVETSGPAQRGTVFVCGGGQLPPEVMSAFVRAAGSAGARLVVVPTASQTADDPRSAAALLTEWHARGVPEVTVLHTRDRAVADRPDFVEPLRGATAVWFGGGDQKRLAIYVDTLVDRELDALLARGGVVGGTSAGAAILSGVIITGGNPEPELGVGFDLVPGTIVDQHFRARRREARLLAAIAGHQELVGLGVDESTALIAGEGSLQVLGTGGVTIVRGKALEFVPAGTTFRLHPRPDG